VNREGTVPSNTSPCAQREKRGGEGKREAKIGEARERGWGRQRGTGGNETLEPLPFYPRAPCQICEGVTGGGGRREKPMEANKKGGGKRGKREFTPWEASKVGGKFIHF